MIYEFVPELILVSAGFDGADGDPIGQCHLSPWIFAYMTHHLVTLSTRLVLVLEVSLLFS